MCYRSKETDLSCMMLFLTDFIDLNGFEAGLLEKRLDLSSDKGHETARSFSPTYTTRG